MWLLFLQKKSDVDPINQINKTLARTAVHPALFQAKLLRANLAT